MSWLAKLYETYEQGMALDLPADLKPMPVGHILQNAHINIVISIEGCFKRGSVLDKTQIVLPATEQSAGRSSGEAPHPLADKLQYVAADYAVYGGEKRPYFEGYRSGLRAWCESEFSHRKALAVLAYIEKGNVVKDLVDQKILFVDAAGKLLTAWPYDVAAEQSLPRLFQVLPKEKGALDQGNALVCWTVEEEGDPIADTWKDASLQESWIQFCGQGEGATGLCNVTGEVTRLALNHPAKLRHTGDKAKLISSNDTSGFTFLGRFTYSESDVKKHGLQAAAVGSITSQKAHNALSWLIRHQGFRTGDQVIVAWAVSGKTVPSPLVSTNDLFNVDNIVKTELSLESEKPKDSVDHPDLGEAFALRLNKYMAGYKTYIGRTANISIMAIDSATPGRMAVVYYRDFWAEDYISRITEWHQQFAWMQRFSKEVDQYDGKAPKKQTIWSVSAPAPHAIFTAIYGDVEKANSALKKNLYERLMPCIVDGSSFPIDLLNSCIRCACNPHASEAWEWQQTLGVACALYRGYFNRHPIQKNRRNYSMTLELLNTSRDYLYGRLLAVAERIEELALRVADENRTTMAMRLMQRFADRPYSTWRNLELALQPYMQRLQVSRVGFLTNRKKELDAILGQFDPADFTSEKALSGEFLLGYHCQRQAFQTKTEVDSTESE